MSLKFKDEIEITTSCDNLMEDANVVLELTRLASNIRKEVYWGFELFPFHFKEIWKKKILICFPWFWTLDLKIFVLCHHLFNTSKGRSVLKIMIQSLYIPCFWNVVNIYIFWLNLKMILLTKELMKILILDIFEMVVNTNEPTRELVNRELVIF